MSGLIQDLIFLPEVGFGVFKYLVLKLNVYYQINKS